MSDELIAYIQERVGQADQVVQRLIRRVEASGEVVDKGASEGHGDDRLPGIQLGIETARVVRGFDLAGIRERATRVVSDAALEGDRERVDAVESEDRKAPLYFLF